MRSDAITGAARAGRLRNGHAAGGGKVDTGFRKNDAKTKI